MNNEKVQAAMDDLKVKQDLYLLSKLEEEYNELSDKCNKLYTFIYSLDFINKVPDCNERCLMQEQLKRMESYRIKLYQRIDIYRCRVKANNPEPWEKDEAARTVETLCGPVRLVDTDKAPKEQLDDILKNGMPDIQVERDPSFDDVSFQAKKLIDVFYATHDRAARLGIAEQILLVMFGQTPDELNGIMEKEARNINSVISAIQHGNEEATHHCGQDASVQDPNESQPADTVPESLKELVGMQIVSVMPPGHKCPGCLFDSDYFRCEKKIELVGGYYLCLADFPISIVTE